MSTLRIHNFSLVVPGDIEGSIAERRERRYLVSATEADAVCAALADFKAEQHPIYNVTTTYLRYGGVPYRLRQYDGGSDFKLECKQRAAGRVLKASFEVDDWIRKASYEGAVTYERSAFEVNGTRITVDREVRTVGRSLGKVVAEVKGPSVPAQLDGLLPQEDLMFGKRQWAVG